MSRWNENKAWKEFRQWLAAAGLGVYMAFSLYAIFFLAEPFAATVIETAPWLFSVSIISWIFRVGVFLNLLAVTWGVMKIIGIQDGEWPN